MKAGIYLHVPFCAKKCPYCDFYSVSYRSETAAAWHRAVLRNLAALPEGLQADSVYYGGGTPSLVPPDMLSEQLEAIAQHCNLSADAEITLEANPRTVTDARLHIWKAAGINRLSVGVQSFHDSLLRTLGRAHTAQQARAAIVRAADAGFTNLSADLMLGLSAQTPEMLEAELDAACALPITHLSVYLLKIEPETPFAANPPQISDGDEAADRWLQMHAKLTASGFSHYEISNFAKPGYESRHNCKYWRGAPYYGIGPGAHSLRGGKRTAVPRDLEAFLRAEIQPETVTDDTPMTDSERIMLALRLREGLCLSDVPQSRAALLKAARPLIPAYLTLSGERLAMTPEGWLVSNSVLTALLAEID